MSAGRVDVGGGTNLMNTGAAVTGGTIVAGAGNDTFTSTSGVFGGSATAVRIGVGAGNDSLDFAGNVTASATVVNLGAGNDTLDFGGNVKNASIVGGAGSDSIAFTNVNWTSTYSSSATSNQYFYGGGTDTLSFTSGVSNTATLLNINVLDGLYTSVSTEVRAGTGINVVGTTGTSDTTIAYILGASQAANITVTEVSQSVIDSVSLLG